MGTDPASVVGRLDEMPGCVGSPETRMVCRLRPRKFVLGADRVGGVEGMVFAAACPLHLAHVEHHVGHLSPLGCWTMPYEAQVFRYLVVEAESEGPTWELQPLVAEAG